MNAHGNAEPAPATGTANPGADRSGAEEPSAAELTNRWRALAVCLTAGFMTLLDVSIVNVALPSMEHGLGASAADISWVVSGYALTFGLALVPAGRLGDDYGRKRMFILGLFLFAGASALCGAATDPTWLVLARLLQGIAGGLLNPQVIGMIQRLFHGAERARAFGRFGATVGLSTAIGPLLGGLLILWGGEDHGWRWVFYVNVPIGALALIAAFRLLPTDHTSGRKRLPDFLGMVLLGAGVVSVMFPLVQAEESNAHPVWWLMGVAAALLALFVLWERHRTARGATALVNLALMKVRSYAMGTTLGTVYFAGFTGIFLVTTLFFQQGLGYTPLQAGLAILPFALGSAISPTIGGRLVHKHGRVVVVLGNLAVAVGLGVTAWLVGRQGTDAIPLIAPLFVAGLGSGLVIAPNQTLALEDVPPAEGGTAAGVLQTGQRVGAAVGIAIAGSLFFGHLSATHGDFHSSTSRGVSGSAGLVVLALLVGLLDLGLSARARRRDRREARANTPESATAGSAATEPAPAVAAATSAPASTADETVADETVADEEPAEAQTDILPVIRAEPRPKTRIESRSGTGAGYAGTEASVRGTVRHPDGTPVPAATVTLISAAGTQHAVTTTDTDGRYALSAASGDYLLVVTATDHEPTAERCRLPADAEHDVALAPAVSLSGTVHENGAPVPGATVTLLDENGQVVTAARTGSQGRYRASGLAPGRYTVVVASAGSTASVVRLDQGEAVAHLAIPGADSHAASV